MVDKVLLILCYFGGGLISIPVDMLAAGPLLQPCWSYWDRPVVNLTNPFPPSDIYFFLQCAYFRYIWGVFLVFISLFPSPIRGSSCRKRSWCCLTWYDRLLPFLFGTHWDAEDCKCMPDTYEY